MVSKQVVEMCNLQKLRGFLVIVFNCGLGMALEKLLNRRANSLETSCCDKKCLWT